MEKYSGNQKGFIYASCDAKIQKEVFEKYLEPLAAEDVNFCWGDAFDKKEEDNIAKSNAVLLFLTKDYVKEDKLRKTVEAAVRHDKPILSAYLEDVELDPGLSMQIESQQAMFVSRYKSDDEFVDDLKKAAIFDKIEVTEQQKKKQKSRSVIAIAAALVALLVLAIVLKPLLTPSSANAETMEALGLAGLSKSELESIVELRIVGTEIISSDANEDEADGIDVISQYFDNGEDKSGIVIMRPNPLGEIGNTVSGDVSDLTGIEQMKNLKVLVLDGQQIQDISPILELKNLEYLGLSCNPVSSLDGLEQLPNLKVLDINGTNVRNLPEGLHLKELYAENCGLRTVPDFGGNSNVYFTANRNEFSDYANLSTAASYDFLQIESHNGLESQIIDSLKGIPVKNFLVAGMQIDSLEDLSELTITEELNIAYCSLTSLKGIEHFEGIERIDLKHDTGLTDLTPLNSLKSLKHVTLSDELAPLDGDIDRIEITYSND